MCFLLRSGFSLPALTYRPDLWSAAELVILLERSPFSTEQCSQSPPRPFYPDRSDWLGGGSSSSRGGVKLLPITDDGGLCAHGDLSCTLL